MFQRYRTRISMIGAGMVVALLGRAMAADGPAVTPVRVGAVTLSWVEKERNLEQVRQMVRKAAEERVQILCLPQECVPSDGGEQAQLALRELAGEAARAKMFLVVNLREQDAAKTYLTSYLVGPDGQIVGKYRKSHRMPDEPIALGDALPVFDTPLGKIGLMIGTDHYWPEIPLVLALEGAELLLWSTAPEPVPQSAPLDVKMRVRALDDHVTIAGADYCNDLPYLCSSYPGYTGQPLGRSYVIDRSGIVVADTGIRVGVAVASVDLKRRKDIFHLTFHEDRKLFGYLVDPGLKPVVHQGSKRRIRVSIAQVFSQHGPAPQADSVFAKTLEEAGRRGSDVILMSEFGFPTNTPAADKTFAMVSQLARKYRSYVIIGGLRDPERPGSSGRATSWAYLWDREGQRAGRYRISQYGGSAELPVFKTDFGVIGLMLCGDIYSQEICRALTLQGAEIVFSGSQSWGASGTYNRWMNQARAIDNAIYLANAHFPFSDIGQQSYVIDPYGQILAGTPYMQEAIVTAEVDLDAGQTWYARSDQPGRAGQPGYLFAYYPKTIPEKRSDLRAVLLAGRRPELYRPIVEATLADRDYPGELKDRIGQPR